MMAGALAAIAHHEVPLRMEAHAEVGGQNTRRSLTSEGDTATHHPGLSTTALVLQEINLLKPL